VLIAKPERTVTCRVALGYPWWEGYRGAPPQPRVVHRNNIRIFTRARVGVVWMFRLSEARAA
jgi:hypothetical protein